MRGNDYDFQYDCTDQPDKLAALGLRDLMESYLALMPTFCEEYETGAYAGYYCPEKVVVLCSEQTFSCGFTLRNASLLLTLERLDDVGPMDPSRDLHAPPEPRSGILE